VLPPGERRRVVFLLGKGDDRGDWNGGINRVGPVGRHRSATRVATVQRPLAIETRPDTSASVPRRLSGTRQTTPSPPEYLFVMRCRTSEADSINPRLSHSVAIRPIVLLALHDDGVRARFAYQL